MVLSNVRTDFNQLDLISLFVNVMRPEGQIINGGAIRPTGLLYNIV